MGGTTRREALPCHCVRCSTQTLCAGFCLPSFDDSTRRGQPPTWLQCSDKAPRGGHFSRHRGPDGATADMLQMLPVLCVGDRLDARDVAATVAAAALKHSSCPSACPLLGTAPGARGNPRCCSTRTTLRVVNVPPCGPPNRRGYRRHCTSFFACSLGCTTRRAAPPSRPTCCSAQT